MAPSGTAVRHEESPIVESQIDPGWTDSADDSWTMEDWTAGGVQALEGSPLQGAPGTAAHMDFGNPRGGSPFPPVVHDESYHGADRVIPGTVTLDLGQDVVFHVYPGHRVAIYKEGVRPEDIHVGTGTFILDATNRIALQAAPVPELKWKFKAPGRYLVICAVRRHFVDSNMYGWVIVR